MSENDKTGDKLAINSKSGDKLAIKDNVVGKLSDKSVLKDKITKELSDKPKMSDKLSDIVMYLENHPQSTSSAIAKLIDLQISSAKN